MPVINMNDKDVIIFDYMAVYLPYDKNEEKAEEKKYEIKTPEIGTEVKYQ